MAKAKPVPVTAHDLLLSFSEWLDGEGLMAPPEDPDTGEPLDDRTHSDLATAFLNEYADTPLGEWATRVSS